MDETLRQLGELLLDSIPTIILFLVAYVGYRILVHKPLLRMLEDRHARTQGAMEKARADVAAAEAKTAEYEQKLREARVSVFKALDTRRQKAMQVRTDILNLAREQAAAQVSQARAQIEADMKTAQAGLQADAESLASEVVARVLRPANLVSVGGGR
jgi:F-type H+-transporting ATPase subunit b